jgi:hypothetical protein
VAAYETGTKEPRLSTLDRLAASAGYRLELRLVPTGRGALSASLADFSAARRLAATNLRRAGEVVGDNAARQWIAEWHTVLERGPKAVRATLLDPTPHGHDMRMTPSQGCSPRMPATPPPP